MMGLERWAVEIGQMGFVVTSRFCLFSERPGSHLKVLGTECHNLPSIFKGAWWLLKLTDSM